MNNCNSSDAITNKNEQKDPIVMYLVVREALNMSIGKTGAQIGHAVGMLMLKFLNSEDLSILSDEKYDLFLNKKHMFLDWLNNSYTKIVLKADEKDWEKLKLQYKDDLVLIIDNGLTEISPNTETVIGLCPMRKSERSKLIKRLQVLK